MKKIIILLTIIGLFTADLVAQTTENTPEQNVATMTYRQTEEIRQALGLDDKQYQNAYKAYTKYNKAVFNALDGSRPAPPPGGMLQPGGKPSGGRPGGPGGGPGMGMPPAGRTPEKAVSKKLEKTRQKQEGKLCKSMKKILGSDSAYERWLKIRQAQLKKVPAENRPFREGKMRD